MHLTCKDQPLLPFVIYFWVKESVSIFLYTIALKFLSKTHLYGYKYFQAICNANHFISVSCLWHHPYFLMILSFFFMLQVQHYYFQSLLICQKSLQTPHCQPFCHSLLYSLTQLSNLLKSTTTCMICSTTFRTQNQLSSWLLS